MVAEAGFEPGWHVLDAGCGAGSFLPLIAEEIGPNGKLTAIDLAPENVETTRKRIAGLEAVERRRGTRKRRSSNCRMRTTRSTPSGVQTFLST